VTLLRTIATHAQYKNGETEGVISRARYFMVRMRGKSAGTVQAREGMP